MAAYSNGVRYHSTGEQYDGNQHKRNVMVCFPTSLGPKP